MAIEPPFDLKKLSRSPLTVRHLCYFMALGYEGHYARAAARVAMAQSPFSRAIKELEAAIGVQLFERTRRSTKITSAGLDLITPASVILHAVEKMQRRVEDMRHGDGIRVAFAFSEGVARMPITVKFFREVDTHKPRILFSIAQLSLKDQIAEFRAGGLQAGMVCSPSSDPLAGDKKLKAYVMWREPLVVAMPAGSPVEDQTIVRSLDKGMGPFLLVGDDSDGLGSLEEIIPVANGKKHLICVASTEMMLACVAMGDGMGILSESQAASISRPDVVIRPLGLRGATMTTYLLTSELFNDRFARHLVELAKAVAIRKGPSAAEGP